MRDLVDDLNGSISKKLEDFQKMTRDFEDLETIKNEKRLIEEDIEDDIDTIVVLGED
jgi:hypothetical protein|tara:strand:+ start:385 stop:555 length:171 start_codon:yes stop_codon:yes gene_type:complete